MRVKNYLPNWTNWLFCASHYISLNNSAENRTIQDIPLETLGQGGLKQQANGTLQFTYQIRNGTETRFFKSEEKFKQFLHASAKVTIWQIQDYRTGENYCYYYAWGKLNKYNNRNDLYEDVASGTEDGVFGIQDMDRCLKQRTSTKNNSENIKYYYQQNKWFQTSYNEISTAEALALISTKQKLQQRKKKAFAAFTLISAAAPIVSTFARCISYSRVLPHNTLETHANKLNFPTHFLTNAITLSSINLMFAKNSLEKSSLHYFTLASTFMTLPYSTLAVGETGNEFAINSYITDAQQYPVVSSLKNGGFIVAWQSNLQDGSGDGVYAKLYDDAGREVNTNSFGNGNAVGNEFQVNSYTLNNQRTPSAIGLTNGDYVIVWQSDGQDTSGYGIYAKRYSENGTELPMPMSGSNTAVDNEFRVNSHTDSDQWFAYQYNSRQNIAALMDGGYIITWISSGQDTSVYGIYAKRYAENGTEVPLSISGTGGAKDNEFPVNTFITNDQWLPAVTAFIDNSFMFAWTSRQDASDRGIFGKLFNSANVATNLPTSGTKNAVASEFPINDFTTNDQFSPYIIPMLDGGFLVLWKSRFQDDSVSDAYGIFGKRYARNGTEMRVSTSGSNNAVGNEFPVNDFTAGNQDFAVATTLLNGNFVVIWSSPQDASGNGIYAKLYTDNVSSFTLPQSGANNAIGDEFLINTNQANDQLRPAITTLLDGSFVVVWQSALQDGSSYGIYGQHFSANGNEIPPPTPQTEPPETSTISPTLTETNNPPSTEFPSRLDPKRKNKMNEGVAIGLGIFFALCCSSALVVGVMGYVFRARLKKIYQSKFKNNNEIEADNFPATQMAYLNPNKTAFEAFLQACELYANRFYLLSKMNVIVAKEIKSRAGYTFNFTNYDDEISGIIASGQFGDTLFAFDKQTQQLVLCKIVKGISACEASKNEAQVHQLVSGRPGIIELIRFGDFTQGPQRDVRYVHFLEYANFGNGDYLVDRLQNIHNASIKNKLLADIVRQLLIGLTTLQSQSVYHGDLKTSNFVVKLTPSLESGEDLQIKLIDFGCSQYLPSGHD